MIRPNSLLILIFLLFQTTALSAQSSHSLTQLYSDSLGDFFLDKAIEVFARDFDSTAIYLEWALEQYREMENWEGIAKCYAGTSTIYLYSGKYVEQDSMIRLNVILANEKLDKKSEAYAAAMNGYALAAKGKGDYTQAINYFRKALENNLLLNNKLHIATSYSNLGGVYFDKGDYDEAVSFLKEAYQYQLDTLGETWRSSTIGVRIGKAFAAQKEFKDANHWYTYSEKILQKERKRVGDTDVVLRPLADVLFELGDLALDQGEMNLARRKVKEARRIAQKVYIQDQGRADDILGNLFWQQNDFEQALTLFVKSKRLAQNEFKAFEKHPIIAQKILNIANVYQSAGNWKLALQHFQEALIMVTQGFYHTDVNENPSVDSIVTKMLGLEALEGKAFCQNQLFQKNGERTSLQQSFETYQLAVQLIPNIRRDLLNQGSKEQLSSRVFPVFEKGIQVAKNCYQLTGEFRYLQEAFQFAESNKAILLLESINEITAKNFVNIPDSLLQKEKELGRDLAYFERRLNEEKQKIKNPSLQTISQLERKIFTLQQQYNELIEWFEKEHPQYYHLKHKTDLVGLEDIQKKITNSSTALIEYFVGLDNVYVFTITSKTIHLDQIAIQHDFLENIKRLHHLISHRPSGREPFSSFKEFTNLAYQLHQKLMIAKLPETIERIIIVPDDVLTLLPFEVLLSKPTKDTIPNYGLDALSYLVEEFDISYSYSSTLLLNWRKKTKKKGELKFTGFAPSFEESETIAMTRSCHANQLNNLKHNQKEVLRIQSLLGGEVFLGKAASLSAFTNDAPQSEIVHLATHACIDENNHQFNKIYFADDYLPQNDLYQLVFQSQLAVLSACNTGTGHLIRGEGIMSLARGFIHAGCPSIVMSLWSVDDRSTSDMMLGFYQYLKNGQAKNHALKQAKIDFINQSKKAQQHPFYWAAFVQFGNTQKLSFKKTFFNSSFLLLFSAVVVGLVMLGYLSFVKRT